MFGIGMPELILILVVALIVVGPQKIPDLARSLGKAFREFKKATSDFEHTIKLDEVKPGTPEALPESLIDAAPDLKGNGTSPLGKESTEDGPEGADKSTGKHTGIDTGSELTGNLENDKQD